MLNKNYIAVPFFVGLSLVANASINLIHEQKEKEIFGKKTAKYCNTEGTFCTEIREKQKLPIKITPPLGLQIALNPLEVRCLARNITQEAVKGYIVDKIHVAWGTINRVKLGYAKTICGVISQPNGMSWYKDPVKRNAPPAYQDIALAKKVLLGEVPNPSPDCMITNWYNVIYDRKDSFNAKYRDREGVCSKRPKNTPHFYMEVSR